LGRAAEAGHRGLCTGVMPWHRARPAAAGVPSSGPNPADTPCWVHNLAEHNSEGGDMGGCEKQVLITLPFLDLLMGFCSVGYR